MFSRRAQRLLVVAACVAGAAQVASAQSLLVNAGFEQGCPSPTPGPVINWSPLGANNFSQGDFARTGSRCLGAFGSFFPGCSPSNPTGLNETGFSFSAPVTLANIGQSITGSIWILNRGNDALGINNRGLCRITFVDSNGAAISSVNSPTFEPSSPDFDFDTYIQRTATGVIPVGTVTVQFAAVFQQEVVTCPSVYQGGFLRFDDASLTIAGGSNVLVNPSFEDVCVGPLPGTWNFFGQDAVVGRFQNGPTDPGVVRTGQFSYRVAGPFFFPGNNTGTSQDFPASAGQRFRASVYFRSREGFNGQTQTNNGLPNVDSEIDSRIRIEFFDANDQNLADGQDGRPLFQSVDMAQGTPRVRSNPNDGCSPEVTPGTNTTPIVFTYAQTPFATAPAGTVRVRYVILNSLPCFNGGDMIFDDADLYRGCPGDFNRSGIRDVNDIFSFLAAWFARSGPADFDTSNVINVNDIFAFLSAWFAGC